MSVAEVAPSPWRIMDDNLDRSLQIPDVVEYVMSHEYAAKPNLYPRQATILKTIFLQDELFTDFDRQVLDEWGSGFSLPPPERRKADEPIRFEGYHGTTPDILDRITLLKAQGRKWFNEVLNVTGRRGGKGYIGGLSGSYVLWHYLMKGDPQDYFGVDVNKKIGCYVFAGKRDQAKTNQWRDLVDVVSNAPCFTKFLGVSTQELLSVYTPHDLDKLAKLRRDGVKTTMDLATFQIVPKESTLMAGRGPALAIIFFDEMAHVVASGANRSAEEVYEAATPALGQFGYDAFKYAGSSPWQMMGKFYELCQQALEVEQVGIDTDGTALFESVYSEKLYLQLESWDPYEDYDKSHTIPIVPKEYAERLADGDVPGRPKSEFYVNLLGLVKNFVRINRPMMEFNEDMAKKERANPETFAVEYRSRWAAAQDAYLNPRFVDEMFESFHIPLPSEIKGLEEPPLRTLHHLTRGQLNLVYAAHGDPSKSGANFGWAIAHAEGPDQDGLLHVVFDKIFHWTPDQWEDGRQDYLTIADEIADDIRAFIPGEVTFDQFNSWMLIGSLQKAVSKMGLPKRVDIYERTATRQLNWAMAETFKTALGMKLLHAPHYEQAELELKFLQDLGGRIEHPTMGPIQTKDVADAMMNVVWALIGDQMSVYLKDALTNLPLGLGSQAFAEVGGVADVTQLHDQEVHQQFKDLARSRGVRGPTVMPGKMPVGGRAVRRRT